MVVRFVGTSNINRWMPAWKARVAELQKKAKLTPKEVAEFTAKYAKTIAPKKTGALIQSVAWKTNKNSGKKSEAFVWIRPVQNKLGGLTTRYASIHHSKSTPQKYLPKRNPKFMFMARERAKELFRERVKIHIQKFKR